MPTPKNSKIESYIIAAYGDISLKRSSNCIEIQFNKTLVNEHTQNIPEGIDAQIHLSTLECVQNDPIYKDAEAKVALLNYLHTWVIRSKNNKLIAFSPDVKQALSVTCKNNDVVNSFEMLFKLLSTENIDLISEFKFDEFIKSITDASVQELLKIPNATKKHLQLIYQNQENFHTLIRNKISPHDLFALPPNSLEKVLQVAESMHRILGFVTMRQILGKSVYPPRLPQAMRPYEQPKEEVSIKDFPIIIEGVVFNITPNKQISYSAYYSDHGPLPNMNLHKLKLFIDHPKEFNKLRTLGLDISEIANISDLRLPLILNNIDTIELTSRLVPIRNIVGLEAQAVEKQFSQNFFPLPESTVSEPDSTDNDNNFTKLNQSKL